MQLKILSIKVIFNMRPSRGYIVMMSSTGSVGMHVHVWVCVFTYFGCGTGSGRESGGGLCTGRLWGCGAERGCIPGQHLHTPWNNGVWDLWSHAHAYKHHIHHTPICRHTHILILKIQEDIHMYSTSSHYELIHSTDTHSQYISEDKYFNTSNIW